MAKQVNTMSTNQTTNAEKANVAKRIFNLIILDESGSMHGLEKMCVDGVNETIQTIKIAAQSNSELYCCRLFGKSSFFIDSFGH